MAYLKGGTYVDGDLYVDGAIKVKNINVLGGNSSVTLYDGSSSVRKYSLIKFATDETNVRAGAVEYSQIFVTEDPNENELTLTFGVPSEDSAGWNTGSLSKGNTIKDVIINHPVSYIKVGMTRHYPTEASINLVLDPSTRTWSYNYE